MFFRRSSDGKNCFQEQLIAITIIARKSGRKGKYLQGQTIARTNGWKSKWLQGQTIEGTRMQVQVVEKQTISLQEEVISRILVAARKGYRNKWFKNM